MIGWFLGTRVGRALGAAVGVLGALLLAFLAGGARQREARAAEDAKRAAEDTATLRKIERGVHDASDDELAARLSRGGMRPPG